MITNYGTERKIGETWIDSIDGAKVITVAGTGCKECAFSTFAGGACPGAVYDRHPCSARDIALLWITSAALLADLAFIGYLMLS